MDFDEILDKVREQLQRKGRLAYQALKVRFSLDDQFIEGLKAELIDADRVAVDLIRTTTLLISDGNGPRFNGMPCLLAQAVTAALEVIGFGKSGNTLL